MQTNERQLSRMADTAEKKPEGSPETKVGFWLGESVALRMTFLCGGGAHMLSLSSRLSKRTRGRLKETKRAAGAQYDIPLTVYRIDYAW